MFPSLRPAAESNCGIISLEGQVIPFILDALEAMVLQKCASALPHIFHSSSQAHASGPRSSASSKRVRCQTSNTIKVFEPSDRNTRGLNRLTFRKLLQGWNDTLRIYKEFLHPRTIELDLFPAHKALRRVR
jgi:hypothetical protein